MKRYYRFGLISLALAVTAMGSAWTWRQHIRTQRERAALKASVALLPAEATAAFGVNLADAAGTIIGEKLKPVLDQMFPSRCEGLDSFETLIGALVTPEGGETKLAAVLTGRFDEAKIASCITSNSSQISAQVEPIARGAHMIYRVQGFDISYLDPHHLGVGTGDAVAQMIDQVDHKTAARALGDNAAMVSLLGKTDRSGALWWAGTLPEQLRGFIKTEAGAESPFVNIGQSRGSVALRSGLDVQIYLVTGKSTAA